MSTNCPSCNPAPSARVLLVEGDCEQRQWLADELRADALEVIEAGSGSEALGRLGAALHSTPPVPFDLIVYDDEVGCDGAFDVLSAVRFTNDRLPVVLITHAEARERRRRARSLGVAAILDKPFSLRDLRTVVLNLTNGPWPRVA